MRGKQACGGQSLSAHGNRGFRMRTWQKFPMGVPARMCIGVPMEGFMSSSVTTAYAGGIPECKCHKMRFTSRVNAKRHAVRASGIIGHRMEPYQCPTVAGIWHLRTRQAMKRKINYRSKGIN